MWGERGIYIYGGQNNTQTYTHTHSMEDLGSLYGTFLLQEHLCGGGLVPGPMKNSLTLLLSDGQRLIWKVISLGCSLSFSSDLSSVLAKSIVVHHKVEVGS